MIAACDSISPATDRQRKEGNGMQGGDSPPSNDKAHGAPGESHRTLLPFEPLHD